jgi:hypothetical protein
MCGVARATPVTGGVKHKWVVTFPLVLLLSM